MPNIYPSNYPTCDGAAERSFVRHVARTEESWCSTQSQSVIGIENVEILVYSIVYIVYFEDLIDSL